MRRNLIGAIAAAVAFGWACDGGGRASGGVALSAVAQACDAKPDRADSATVPEVSPEVLGAHLRFLAHDSLEGRGTGTAGYDRAAEYVAACFRVLGLEPAGTDGYLQPVPFRRARTVQGTALVLEGPSGRRELVIEEDYLPAPDLLRERSEITAPLVLAGFGVTAPSRKYDDYRKVDAQGKIVVLLTGAPASFPATERAHFANSRVKYENAVRHGAVGVLLVRTRDQTFPWDRAVRQARGGTMAWLDEQGKPHGGFPELRARATLSDAAAQRLFEEAPQSHDAVLTAAERGLPPAFDLPVRATIRTVNQHQRLTSPNVGGLLTGSDPRLGEEVVVFTAHLDHLGIGEPVQGDSIYNGALDNASGSAALLEVARAFVRLPERPRRSVLFLAVTAEEMGLLGSDYFAEFPTVPIERIVANVNLDGLAILYPLRELVPLGAEHSTLDSAVARAAHRMDITLGPDPFPQEVFFVRSDQYSFVRRGVPSLFLFMGFRTDSGIDAADRFRKWLATRYHLPQDDLEQPLNLEAGARHAQLNFLAGLEVANAEQRPAWKAGDFFGKTFGRPQAAEADREHASAP